MAQPSEHLSFRGYNALGLQVNSSFFSFWLPGKGQNSTGLVAAISTEAGGTLCNLGYLSSLVELNLCGNSFTNIPAARISDLTELLAPSSPWTWLIQLWNNMLKVTAE
ncbi:hypothetical protein AABB24_020837 [Solanum stoloniferum]|uniref:Uncharacterized protein n=1 Tax=Solanum stoloniferum TaxID=62892 RepID=A0ABD2TA93_9SOLN